MIDWPSVGWVLLWLSLAFSGVWLWMEEGLEKRDWLVAGLGLLVMAGGVLPFAFSFAALFG